MSDKPVYVYSTLSSGQNYAIWEPRPNGIPEKVKDIFIAGGANVANKNLITPRGVVTKISREDAALLQNSRHFKQHEANGFVKISDEKVAVEVAVAADMEGRDASAPLVPEDYQDNDLKPVSNAPKRKGGRKAAEDQADAD